MIIATAGHVDHGKTLLVKQLSGIETDRLEEEKNRGLTIDLGFAYQQLEDHTTLGFVDVPGHIRFINNMLAGVGAIDHALLVIAADDGPMPQTREHLDILNLLGIGNGTIALTKIDRVADDRVEQVMEEINLLVSSTKLKDARIFPVSSITGAGISELKDHLVSESDQLTARPQQGNFRLAIDRCFTIKGSGLVVTGSVFSGQVKPGDELVVSPTNLTVKVRGVRAQNKVTTLGKTGDRCAVNLTGTQLSRDMIARGDWLLHPELHAPTTRIDARISVLVSEAKPLRHWTPVHVHSAATHVTGRVAILEDKLINAGESGLVQLVIDEPISICKGDKLIIRDQSAARTLGGGLVLDPFAPARGRSKPQRLASLKAMEMDKVPDCLRALLALEPGGVNLTAFGRGWNLPHDERISLFGTIVYRQVSLVSGGREYLAGYSEAAWEDLKSAVVKALKQWHQDNPAVAGPGERQLRQCITPRPWPETFSLLCSELVKARSMFKSAALFHAPGHAASLEPAEARIWQSIEPVIRKEGLKPPVTHELAKRSGIQLKQLESFIGKAIQLGLLVRVVKNRLFLPETVEQLSTIVESVAAQSQDGLFTASDYRDATGIGRNLAIEVLEYFDRTGFTQRRADKRKLTTTGLQKNE